MRAGKNFLAGVLNSCWGALIGMFAVPYYIKYLGVESYGLIGFFVMMQAALSLLDLGLSPTMNREVARHSALGTIQEARVLLHTLGILYIGISFLMAIIIYFGAPYLATRWLNAGEMDPTALKHAIILMGVVIACRWPIGLYQGVLMGKQLMLLSSKLNIGMVSLSNLGAVLVLSYLSPTIEAFFLWQGLVGVLYLFVMRWMAWGVLGREVNCKFDIKNLKKIWRFSVGMSGVAVSSIILLQLDKVLLSRLLTLEDFGLYSLAMVLAGGLSVLTAPLFNVIFPLFSGLVAKNKQNQILGIYKTGANIFSGIIFSVAFSIALNAHEIIYLWVRDINITNKISSLVSLLIIGGAINGVMIFPYALQLAYGLTRITLVIILSLILVYAPTTYLLVNYYGMLGGGISWALLNLTYLFFGTWLTHKRLFVDEGFKWILNDVLIPACISFGVIFLGGLIASSFLSSLAKIFIVLIFLIAAIFINYSILSKKTKLEFVAILKNSRKQEGINV